MNVGFTSSFSVNGRKLAFRFPELGEKEQMASIKLGLEKIQLVLEE